MKPKGTANGINQISDDRTGLNGTVQAPAITQRNFADDKGSSLPFGEDNPVIIDSSIPNEKRRRRRKRRQTLKVYFWEF
ncbi:hypothetical protein LOAG_03654 [Loa loa]|uniref:Uncharacterized protein n=1 Tax=Loa loa TaxID=7209 RepID=A0A1S0U3M4_LOALO|nr:hypothetical protein LOAG_03654 [Loa loa]EFO24825.1 hypothetical protein LOAG_03654 [Loa loa]